MEFYRLAGTYKREDNTLTKVNNEVPELRSYRIANRDDGRKVKYFCKERAEANIRDFISGQSAWEDRITIEELIKKGALIPQ